MFTLKTDRLIISKLTVNNAAFILELLNDAAFLRFIGDRGVKSLEDARNYIETGPLASYAQYGFGLYLTSLKHDGVPIGMCGLLKRDSLDNVDIGYAFLPQFRGQGYALEAATAVTQYAQNTLKLNRIVAITTPDNMKSIKLLGKLGFYFDRMVRLSAEGAESNLFVLDFN